MLRPANCVDLRVCLRTWFCLRKQLYGFRKSSVLYQGTTLVVPHKIDNTSGFRGCVSTGRKNRRSLHYAPSELRSDNSVAGQACQAKALAGITELSSRPELRRSVVEGPAVLSASTHTPSRA
jgi:hypothetical protein